MQSFSLYICFPLPQLARRVHWVPHICPLISFTYYGSSSSSSRPFRQDVSDGMTLISITCSEPELLSFSSMAHLHIVGLAFGQTLCLGFYLLCVNVEGKSSRTYSLEDMGTFPFSHTFLLHEEEQLVSLHPSWLRRILWQL